MNEATTKERAPVMATVAAVIASTLQAMRNCETSGNEEWREKHSDALRDLVGNYLPSGSGINAGCVLVVDKCNDTRLVFDVLFHHMNESGMYDGWTDYVVTARASLAFGLDVSVRGRNRDCTKEYLAELFSGALTQEIPRYANRR